jgi:hypothetical protein
MTITSIAPIFVPAVSVPCVKSLITALVGMVVAGTVAGALYPPPPPPHANNGIVARTSSTMEDSVFFILPNLRAMINSDRKEARRPDRRLDGICRLSDYTLFPPLPRFGSSGRRLIVE